MLQRVNDIRVATSEMLRTPVMLKAELDGNGNMQVSFHSDNGRQQLCMLKYDGQQLKCIINSTRETFVLDDSVTIDYHCHLIEVLSGVIRGTD